MLVRFCKLVGSSFFVDPDLHPWWLNEWKNEWIRGKFVLFDYSQSLPLTSVILTIWGRPTYWAYYGRNLLVKGIQRIICLLCLLSEIKEWHITKKQNIIYCPFFILLLYLRNIGLGASECLKKVPKCAKWGQLGFDVESGLRKAGIPWRP